MWHEAVDFTALIQDKDRRWKHSKDGHGVQEETGSASLGYHLC